MPGWDKPMPWDKKTYDPVEGDLVEYEGKGSTLGELIGPERLKELRAARAKEIEEAQQRHPSMMVEGEWPGDEMAGSDVMDLDDAGADRLLAAIRGMSEGERDVVKEIFEVQREFGTDEDNNGRVED